MVGVEYAIFVNSKLKFVKRDAFASGYMAYAGVSFHVKTELHIIKIGEEVNSQFPIDKVLKFFINNNIPRMFHGYQYMNRNIFTLARLKRALKTEWKKLKQSVENKLLSNGPNDAGLSTTSMDPK